MVMKPILVYGIVYTGIPITNNLIYYDSLVDYIFLITKKLLLRLFNLKTEMFAVKIVMD